MTIAVVGIGGVGGYIGGKLLLSKKDEKIVFISRGKQLQKIKQDGLKLIDEDREYIVKPEIITDDPKEVGEFDLVLICVKSYDLKNALKLLKDNISDKTILLPLLNGVEHDKEVKTIYPNAKVLNGCIYILSNIKDIGIVKKYGGVFNLIYGSSEYNLDEFKWIKELFDRAGLKNKLTSDIELETWKKYLLIAAYASMTSCYDKPLGFIAQNKLDELENVLYEIKSVANAKGVKIDSKTVSKIAERLPTLPYDSKTSMQLDFENGKKTEVEALCGYIVKKGKMLSIDTPLMKKYYEKLNHK